MGEKKKGRVICIIITMLMIVSIFASNINANTSKNAKSSDFFQSNEIQPLGTPLSETDTFNCLSYDGDISTFSSTYSYAWSASSGVTDYSDHNFSVGQQAIVFPTMTIYAVSRGCVYFDTGSIPDNADVLSAKLSLFCYMVNTYHDYDVVIQNGQPTYPHKPMEGGDYDKTHYSGNGGSLHSGQFIDDSYNDITLNSNGQSWINKQGTTKLVLRTSRDINGDSPYEGSDIGIYRESIGIFPYEMTTYFSPRLIVTYEVQIDPPSVDTLAASGVGMTYATLKGKILDDGGAACQVRFQIKRDGGSWWYEPDHWFGSYIKGMEVAGGMSPIIGLVHIILVKHLVKALAD